MWFGILLVLAGLSILLKIFFGVNLPIFRVALALFFFYLGARMIMGGWDNNNRGAQQGSWKSGILRDHDSVIFGSGEFKPEVGSGEIRDRFSVIFGEGRVDLRAIPATQDAEIRVSTVFGQTHILLPKNVPVLIRAETVFGESKLPGPTTAAVGRTLYRTPGTVEPKLKIRASVVFGELIWDGLPESPESP